MSRDAVDIAAERLGLDEAQRAVLRDVLRVSAAETLPESRGAAETFADLDGAPPLAPPRVEGGPVLPSRYRLRHRLGRGGMADVWSVRDQQLERTVALKVLRLDVRGRADLVRRFREEARITARLQHPGNVPVYDTGTLDDGRLYFTMKEVRGRTFEAVIADAHGESGGWSLRRLLDALHRCTEAVAYAHSRGVVHRDLKPGNLMVGEFGEVLVLDWGLARFFADAAQPGSAIAGTPAYMSPEQASGGPLGPQSDVYSIGAILHEVLSGERAFAGDTAREVLDAVRAGERRPLAQDGSIPPRLASIVERAMSRAPGARFPDARSLGAELGAWLEGQRRRARALELVAEAVAAMPDVDALHRRARVASVDARRAAKRVVAWAPIEDKRAVWAAEDEARRLADAAAMAELRVEQLMQGALTHDPELPEAHRHLADLYRTGHGRAEAARSAAETRRYGALLVAHDDGRHARYLDGRGSLSVVTDPPAARVTVLRLVEKDRRLVETPIPALPTRSAPLQRLTLPMGSYLVVLEAPGCEMVRYPVHIGRMERHDGVPPGATEPVAVRLPRVGELGADDAYVAAGPAWIGGDPHASTCPPLQRRWVEAFVMKRHPVTNRQYIAFLDDLVARGEPERAEALVPRERTTGTAADGTVAFALGDDGRHRPVPDADGDAWDLDWPVILVDWSAACAYAAWHAERTGQAWRLPTELEWEKAARGVDARYFPWGDHFDATWTRVRNSLPGRRLPARVGELPDDVSVYGVHGMAGNVSDWCSDGVGDGPESARRVRGGAFSFADTYARIALQRDVMPELRRETLGFRLVRSA